jgi:uncharacterized repeat protein (TIGR01451 family)
MLQIANIASRKLLIHWLMLCVLILTAVASQDALAVRTFASRFSANKPGDIIIIGNTLMTCPGVCPTIQDGTSNNNLNNNNHSMTDVNSNGFPPLTVAGAGFVAPANSSRATLNMPTGSFVEFAGLYWAGDANLTTARNRARFITPLSDTLPTATQIDDAVAGGTAFQSFVDVTSQVRLAGNGTYIVGNVQTRAGLAATANVYGGWALVVVYSNPSAPARNMNVFDGMTTVSNGNPVNISVGPFITPAAGPVNARVGIVAYEGDRGPAGNDSLRFNGTRITPASAGTQVSIVDGANPNTNFFNSSISRLGADVTLTKTPDFINQLGVDIDLVDIPNAGNTVIRNGDDGAVISLSTTVDNYFPGVVTSSVDIILPTISKSFTPATIAVGAPSTLRFTLTNGNATTLTNANFTDTLTGISLAATTIGGTCVGVTNSPALVVGATGTNALNLTVPNFPTGSCTIDVQVTSAVAGAYPNTTSGVSTATTAAGTQSNTATLTVTPVGVNVNGFVYSDANHNIQKDTAEAGTALTLFAKLIPTTGGNALQAVAVNPTTGAYQLPAVAVGNYSIIIDDNNSLTDTTPNVPVGWLGTEMPNFIRANIAVSTTELQNLNFGLFNGSKLSGTVFSDTGTTGGTANNGIKDGGELGIAGVTVKASTGATIHDTAITDGAGNYTLWIPATATSPVLISETNLSNYLSTGGSVGNSAGTYTRATDVTSFTNTAGTIYSNVNFADVPVNSFAANGQQSGLPGNVLFYAHQFNAGSAGSVVFSSTSAPVWPTIIYRDLNCNGVIDATDTVLSTATAVAGGQICVVNKVTIPAGTGLGLQNSTNIQAVFTYTSASPALTSTLSVIDTTTAGVGSAALVLTKTVDKATALAGDTVTYTLTYQNNSNAPISGIVINDATPAHTNFFAASCVTPLPAAISSCAVTSSPAIGATGSVIWTLTGTLSPSATGQVRYSVKVNN